MVGVLNGIRVVEVAAWTYVPVAGAILAEWGADVLKIEHPESGDPQRGLVTSGLIPAGGVNHMFELPNRGKRSVAIDLKSEQGRALLMRLIATADVFLTNFRPDARKKLGLGLLETFSEPCEVCAGRGVIVHHDPVVKHRGPQQQSSGGRRTRQNGPSAQAGAGGGTHVITESAKSALAQIAASTIHSHEEPAADDHRLVAQAGIVAFFHRGVEGVTVDMGDG